MAKKKCCGTFPYRKTFKTGGELGNETTDCCGNEIYNLVISECCLDNVPRINGMC